MAPGRRIDPRLILGADVLEHVAALFSSNHGIIGRHVPGGRTLWGLRSGRFDVEAIARVLAGDGSETPGILALRFGEETRFGLLDLDVGSPYHTEETRAALFRAAESLGLRVTLCRSSDSGGWHVYLWCAERVASADMNRALRALALAAGIDRFQDGVCEVYPSPERRNKAVRLPGQPGFAWLADDDPTTLREFATTDTTGRFRHLVTWARESSVRRGALLAAVAAVPPDAMAARVPRGRPPKLRPPPAGDGLPDAASLRLQEALVYRYDRNAARAGRPDFATVAAARFAEGARRYALGLERRGSRHESLLLVSFYLFFVGYTDASERERLLTRWMEERHCGMSREWSDPTSRDRVLAEIHRVAHWRPGTKPETGFKAINATRESCASLALADAIRRLRSQGEKVTYRRLTELTGLSSRTIARHGGTKSVAEAKSVKRGANTTRSR